MYSALPYIAMVIVGNLASNVIDKLRQGKMLSTVAARKMALAIGMYYKYSQFLKFAVDDWKSSNWCTEKALF